MTLADYLVETDTRLTAMAAAVGVPVTTMHGYVSGRRLPPVGVVARIESITSDRVRACDFVIAQADAA